MRVWICIVLYFLPALLLGQISERSDSDRFNIYLQKYLQTSGATTATSTDLISLVDKLDIKRDCKENDTQFLKVVFDKLHKKFLKRYSDYTPFSELFNSGTYNCLTASSLYALVLDHFSYDYKVIETNYHIFLLVKTGDREILLETTDPQSGFIDDQTKIEAKIKQYRQNKIADTSSKRTYYHFQFDLYNEVDLNELIGLLYYNQAVAAFNQNRLDESVDLLDQATRYYRSERIEEFSRVILLTLTRSNLESSAKRAYYNKVTSLRRHNIL